MFMSRIGKSTIGLGTAALMVVLAVTVSVAASTAAPATTTGSVHIWVTPGKGAVDRILLSGVIADDGTATSIDKDGKVDENGDYVKIALQHGGFEVNASAFNKSFSDQQPTENKSTCSAWQTVSGPVTLYNGTGAYAGIKGTVRIGTSFAILLPRYKSGAKQGQCNVSNNANPVAEFDGDIIGSGQISY
jgi:hypothetical protein